MVNDRLVSIITLQAITSLVSFLHGPISIVLCGHLGKRTLATVGLAISFINITGMGVVTGLLTAADTLFSQTFGGQTKYMMGIQLQRGKIQYTNVGFRDAKDDIYSE
ncbi:unnamed protein product [Dicrocoelium dendriticum]|nr:unnamed protein product [Dicrocoelium dendriticum]